MIKVIKNGIVITMDEKRDKKYEQLDIIIEDNKIINITKDYNKQYDELIDATGKIVMPGLINCHTHLGMSIFRATSDDLNLNDWLNKKIWPIENNMTDEDVYYTSLLSIIEMIKTGTTCCNDMYFGCNGTLKALNETNFRCLFGKNLMDINSNKDEQIKDFLNLYKENKNNLINWSITPHSLYTCSKELLKDCKKLSNQLNIPIHIHFCENKNEVITIKKKFHKNPVKVLKELGFLENKLILAHGTFISDKELKLLKNKNISIVHNPISNLNLGCGIADISKYKNYVNIALGTDGQGSGNNLNLFYHMSVVDCLQDGKYENPTTMNSYEVLKMATINGSKALGLDKEIGSIEVGKKADIIILDLNNIEIYPTVDIITNIVHNVQNNNIDTTIIDGNILMKNHKLCLDIDENKLKENINKIIERLGMKIEK